MSMKMYTVNAVLNLNAGNVVLNADQARRRRRALKKIEGHLYEIVKPVQFKVGEQVGLDQDTLRQVHKVNLSAVAGQDEPEEGYEDAADDSQENGGDQDGGDKEDDQTENQAAIAGGADLDSLHWTQLKMMVEDAGGEWVNKPKGIEFLKQKIAENAAG